MLDLLWTKDGGRNVILLEAAEGKWVTAPRYHEIAVTEYPGPQ
jgi:hypothetical protein